MAAMRGGMLRAQGPPGVAAQCPPMTQQRSSRRHPGVATITDVARHAGVSPMTVSRVVNGEPGVRPALREAVQAAVAALQYMPNPAARRLVGSELVRLGVLYSNPSAGYLSELLVGLLNQASLLHVQLLVEPCGDEPQHPQHAARLLDQGVDGLLLPPPLGDARALLDLVAARDVPAVAVASGKPDACVGAVGIDDREAAREMTRHLLALGHERIAFVTGHPNQTASRLRLQGWRDAMTQAGLVPEPRLVAKGQFSYRSGLDAAESLLALNPRPTAVFASNDDMAAATVAVAHRLGLDVPGDLTVAGFDDTAIASTIWPGLTTIRQPIAEMARRALDLLVEQVRQRRAGQPAPPRHERMPFMLLRRQSDAAPRARPPLRGAARTRATPR